MTGPANTVRFLAAMAVLDWLYFFFLQKSWCNLVIQCHCNFRVWSSAMVHHRMFDSIIGCCLASKRLANYISKILWKTILQCRLPKFAALMHTFFNTAPHQSFESKVFSRVLMMNRNQIHWFQFIISTLLQLLLGGFAIFPLLFGGPKRYQWSNRLVVDCQKWICTFLSLFSRSLRVTYFLIFSRCFSLADMFIINHKRILRFNSVLPDILGTCSIWRMQCC